MSRVTCVAVAAVVLMCTCLGHVRGQSDEFVVAYGSPTGYVPATLHDLQTALFVNDYNINGIFVGASNTLPSSGGFFACPLLAVEEGVMTIGSLAHQNNFAVFSTGGVLQSGDTLATGTPFFFGLANPINFVGANWNASFGGSIYATPATEACTGSSTPATWTLYIKADYVLATLGNSGSHPIGGAGTLASSDDVRSPHFASVYNANGGIWPFRGNVTLDGCCVIRLHDGYLTYSVDGDSPFVEPFIGGVDQCSNGLATLTAEVQLGLRSYGSFPTINFTSRGDFGVAPASALPGYCSSMPPQSLALYKVHPAPPPTPAPAHHGDCYKVTLQVSYYLPNVPICLADRWRFLMRLNETYSTIGMTSLDECTFTVNMHKITLKPYTEHHAVIYSGEGATQCPCIGSQIVPYNWTGVSEMATICQYNVGEFNWCELLFQFDETDPIRCPPPPPPQALNPQ